MNIDGWIAVLSLQKKESREKNAGATQRWRFEQKALWRLFEVTHSEVALVFKELDRGYDCFPSQQRFGRCFASVSTKEDGSHQRLCNPPKRRQPPPITIDDSRVESSKEDEGIFKTTRAVWKPCEADRRHPRSLPGGGTPPELRDFGVLR